MRTVLITGSSAGFGLLATVELAKRGWRVIATMRSLARKGPLEAALSSAGVRQNVDILQLDVTDAESTSKGVEAALTLTGGFLDAVVNNAGVAAGGAFEDIPEAELRRVMETNFFGVMAVTRALLPTFRKQRSGRIIIISSESAFHGQPGNSIYCASKWAVEGWAESLAYDVDQFGIKVLLIEPGPYVTDIWQASPRFAPSGSVYRRWSENVFRSGDAHLAGKGGDPREVATKIANVLEANKPPFRSPVHRISHFTRFARGKVPTLWFRKIVGSYLGLNRVRL